MKNIIDKIQKNSLYGKFDNNDVNSLYPNAVNNPSTTIVVISQDDCGGMTREEIIECLQKHHPENFV